MTELTIEATNIGPIHNASLKLAGHGVTVIAGPNGAGKTILVESIRKAVAGKGGVPLRDGAARGRLEVFGATITVGGRCNHSGEMIVTGIDGKLNLDDVVDPKIDDPDRADAARIRSLVRFLGITASQELFTRHPAFTDFAAIVSADAVDTEDLCDMARKIKADYDKAAKAQEGISQREQGSATALKTHDGVDMDAESDAGKLNSSYNAARDERTALSERVKQAKADAERRAEAQKSIDGLSGNDIDSEHQCVKNELTAAQAAKLSAEERIEELTRQILDAKETMRDIDTSIGGHVRNLDHIEKTRTLIAAAKAITGKQATPMPTSDELEAASAAVETAQNAVELGAVIRKARADEMKAGEHRKASNVARDNALKYRDAGKATDEVLSAAIKCPQLRVESNGKAARLVTTTDRSKSTMFHELSAGQKYKLVINMGADLVGENGLLTISQEGWEGLDVWTRPEIHAHAVERKVYIIAIEAQRDETASKEIQASLFGTETKPVKTPTLISEESNEVPW